MSAMQTEIKVVRKQAPLGLKWFTGDNVLEVAAWLTGHGLRPSVSFHQFGENLSINGYTKDVDKIEREKHGGVWIDSKGQMHTKGEIDTDWTVIP